MSEFPEHVVEIEERLRQIAGLVRRRGRMLLEQYGITPPQFDALLILNHNEDLTIGDLSNRMFLAYSTTTDLVDRLERAGFVIRQRDAEDRRVVRVSIQASGKDLIGRVLDARRGYLATILEPLEAESRAQVIKVLDLLHARMVDGAS